MKQPTTLYELASKLNVLNEDSIIRCLRKYSTMRPSRLEIRLDLELSKFEIETDISLVRKLIHCIIARACLFSERNRSILISRLSEHIEQSTPWSHGAPLLRRELDDEENYDYEAQAFGDVTITHKLYIPAFDEFFKTIKKALPKNRAKSIEKLSLNLGAMFMCASKEAFYLAVANIVAEFVSVYDVVSTLLEKIDFEHLYQLIVRVGKFLTDPHGYEAQSSSYTGSLDSDSFGALFRVLATGYAFLFDEKIKHFPTFSTEWQKNLFAAYRNTSCIPELYDFMIMFVRSTYEFFQIYILGVDVDYDLTLCQVDATYDQWKKDLFRLEAIYMDPLDGIFRNPETRRQIIEHYVLGQKLNDVIEHQKTMTRGAGAHFQALFTKSTKMGIEARKASSSSNFRAPPYMIQIAGASGIGKSTCIERTVMYLNQFEKVKYDEGNLIFTRKATSQYWEGYHSQLAVVYDDLFQIKETKDRAAAAEEIVDVCNSVPLALNMAELSAKGNVMFNSKFVFATTNVWEERSIGLAHPDALWRRFGSRWKFSYPKKYEGKRGPDWEQMHKDNPSFKKEGRESELMYAKLICTLVRPNGRNKTMTYDKFLKYIHADAQRKFKFDSTALEVNRKYIETKFGKIDTTPVPLTRVVHNPVYGEVSVPYVPKVEAQGFFGDDDVVNYELCPDSLRQFMDMKEGTLLSDTSFGEIVYEAPVTHGIMDTVLNTISLHANSISETACSYVDSWVYRAIRYMYPNALDEEVTTFSALAHLRTAKRNLGNSGYQEIFDVAFKALLVVATFKAGSAIYRRLKRGSHWSQKFYYESQSNEFKDRKRRKKRKVKGNKPKFFTSSDQTYADDDYNAEGKGTDSNYLSRIRANMCRIECTFSYDDYVRKDTQNIVFITGSSALTTAHLLYNFDDCDKDASYVRLITGSLDKIIYVRDLTWITPDERCGLDVGLLKFNIKGIQRPDITSRFITEAQLENVRVNECTLMKFCRTSDRKGVFVDREMDSGRLGKVSPTYTYLEDEFTVSDCIRYKCFTERGDCGSIVTHNDSSIPAVILGIHVAGRPNNPDGIGQVVTRELLTMMLEKAGVTTRRETVVESEALEEGAGAWTAYGQIDTIGRLSPSDATRMPSKTSLLPSKVFDVFQEHTHEPAMLTKTGDISPVHVALAKANVPDGKLDRELFKECEVHMENIRKSLPTYGLARTLTNEEMVNGFPGTNYLKPLNIHTSPGFPYTKGRKQPGKQDWFKPADPEKEGSKIQMSLKFKHEFEETEEKLARGIIPMFPFVACLKDEKREKSKVAAGKARLFSVGNQMHLSLCRKYYGGYVAFLTANKDVLPSKVGLVMNGVEFHDFYQYMVKNRTKSEALNNANDGDFSGFDDSLMSECIVSFFESARRWYLFHNGTGEITAEQQRDDAIRRNLVQTFIGPPHMLGNMLYSLTKANSSGGFATVHINGHANELAHRYTFCELGRPFAMENKDFDSYVNLATYGDDSLMVIGDEVVSFFNGKTIAPIFKEAFGMTYTTATKGAAETPVRPMSEVDFCKRKFFFNHNLRKMVGRMEVENILESTNWIRKSNDDDYATLQNVESAHREFVLHGREVYDKYSKIFVDGCARVGLTYLPRSFRSLQDCFYKNEL